MTNLKTIPAVMTPGECQAMVVRAEGEGLLPMGERYPASYRNNDRVLLDDPALAARMFARLRGCLEQEREMGERTWRLLGLNSRFRVCRYRDGQRFSLHRDGSYATSDRARSLTTVMVYLNGASEFEGGRTRFYDNGREGRAPSRLIVPQQGMAAVFDHHLWHDGEAVTSGCKYVLRTDVLYESDQNLSGEHRGYIWCLETGPGGTLASGSRDCCIRLWRGDELAGELRGHTSSVLTLSMHRGELWSAARDGQLRRWCGRQSEVVRSRGAAILSMASSRGGHLACATSAGDIELWEPTGMVSHRRAHDGWVWQIARDGDAIVSCSEDGSLRCEGPGRSWRAFVRSPLRALAVTEVGIVAAGLDGRIRCWSPAGEPRPSLGTHDAPVTALAAYRERIFSADEDGHVYAWEDGERRLVTRHDDQVRALHVADGRLWSASYDGTLRASSVSVRARGWPSSARSARRGSARRSSP